MAQNIINVDAAKSIESTVAELQLPRRPLIVLLSDFDGKLNDQVRSICSRVIAPAAVETGALILDDARCFGCAKLIAQAALQEDKMPSLLGVVPNGRTASDIDADHETILRLPPAWADSAKYTFQIADELVKDGTNTKPTVAVLFGGSDEEKKALLRCARRHWPVLILQGTGGIADEITNARAAQSNGSAGAITDPELREILESGSICASSIDASVDDLNRILLGRIGGTNVLSQVLLRFDELDLTAIAKQARFRVIETALITLAVLAALFAILTTANAVPISTRAWLHSEGLPTGILHWLVLLTPITISVIAAYNSHFRDGNKWILLRGAAEALKREIFRFRAKAGEYSDEACVDASRELKLAAKLKDITSALEQSEVNKTNLLSVPKIVSAIEEKQGRNTFLSPDEYVEARLKDQVKHLTRKTGKLARQFRTLQFLIYVAGAAGTLLAAVRRDVWVALATAVVTALTTKLQTDQVENSLMQYNQALASLRNIDTWWTALSRWEKSRRQNIDLLVEQTEKVLESETAGWVQQMQSGLDKLTEKQQQK